MGIEIKSYQHPMNSKTSIMATFDSMAEAFNEALIGEIIQKIAERYVEENYVSIAAKLDQNAIANLAVADAGKKIAEEIRSRPTLIEKTKTEVYQRGIFGGTRRVR